MKTFEQILKEQGVMNDDDTLNKDYERCALIFAQQLPPQSEISDEDIINYALDYINQKDLKTANKGLIKDALIIGAKAIRDGKISRYNSK